MKPKQLKDWMREHQKTPTDVASLTGVSIWTVNRFLDGKTDHPQPLVMGAFRKLVESPSQTSKDSDA